MSCTLIVYSINVKMVLFIPGFKTVTYKLDQLTEQMILYESVTIILF